MVALFLRGISILFSMVAAPIYIPNSVLGFPFSTPSLTFVISYLFNDNHFNSVRWCLIVGFFFLILFALHIPFSLWFWFAFSIISDVEHLFMCLNWPSVCLFKKNIQILCPFSKLDCLVFCCWLLWVLYVFWILTPYHSYVDSKNKQTSEIKLIDAEIRLVISRGEWGWGMGKNKGGQLYGNGW